MDHGQDGGNAGTGVSIGAAREEFTNRFEPRSDEAFAGWRHRWFFSTYLNIATKQMSQDLQSAGSGGAQ